MDWNEITIVEINKVAGSTMEVITVDNVAMEIARTEINPNQNGGMKKEVPSVQKRPQVKEVLETHTHLLPK
jgi:predicted transcriptional regulator